MLKFTLYILIAYTTIAYSQVDSLITYFNNGNIESILRYKNGMRDGEVKFFWENGNIKQELSYFNGRVNGLVVNYNENGLICEMYSIVNGKREGPSSYFDSLGVYVNDVFYTEGMLDVEKEPLRYSNTNEKLNNNKVNQTNKKKKQKINTDQPLPPTIEEERNLEEDPAFYLSVEVMPEPIGGMKAIYKKISATGGSASAAISFLKKRGAENIIFACIVASPEGINRINENHPDVRIFGAALDRELNEKGYILPGLGDAGDRTFGTL